MPEGDTIWRAAAAVRRRAGGRQVRSARPAALGRLAGRRLLDVDTVGKHMYMRFSDDLVLHTHMRMTGAWHVYDRDQTWRRAPHLATAVLDFDDVIAVLFAAPVCELIRPAAIGLRLGPDILGPTFDVAAVVARVRESQRATIGEILLDQWVCSGIGNIHRCNALWHERLDPLGAPSDLDDETLRRLYERARDLMRRAVVGDRFRPGTQVHGRAGRPCAACGGLIASQPLGQPSRIVYWCPRCQTRGSRRPHGMDHVNAPPVDSMVTVRRPVLP